MRIRSLGDTLFHARLVAAFVVGTALVAGCAGGTASATPESVVATISPSATIPMPTPSVAATASASLLGVTTPASSAPPGAIVVQTSSNSLAYEPTELTAKAGTVAFFVMNVRPGGDRTGRRHNIAIGTVVGEPLVKSFPAVDEGKAAIFTVEDLPAGEYVFFCTVLEGAAQTPHFKAGMVGKLIVTP